jgi:sec-independent protein translocase protein TatB
MIDFGFDKIALIGAVALIVIGPEKLPRVARTVGHLLGKAQRYVADVKAEVNRSIELEELKKMKTQFEDAARDVEQTVHNEVNAQPASSSAGGWQDGLDHGSPTASAQHLAPRPAGVQAPEEEAGASSAAPRRSGTSSAPACAPCAVGRGARGALPPPGMKGAGGRELHRARPARRTCRHRAALRLAPDRAARPLVRALIAVGLAFGVLCLWPGPPALYDLLAAPLVAHLPKGTKLIATNVISPFMVPLKITLMAAFLLALPYVLYQLWAFVAPGLYSHEKRWCCRWW